ncbi:ferritin-like domain-containing protein [Streptomyces sp. NRRL F-4474]|uniref:ferritin-like domain-containing protein n=1 Tax=Streptomyces sp. NRRL F-4474 TaxID=1463851 RepID=UPI0004C71888|nr:ferritin-like domain-containing protein [Streptomyces sp. NRRL F-4474]
MPELPPPAGKFFPRNLTARADYQVRGNPSGSRPESGVDNCFPGLEFDQRNLDTAFFPGLRVDFHRSDGARVLSIAGRPPFPDKLGNGDVSDSRPLYIRALCGRTTVDQGEEQAVVVDCAGMDGLDVWRRVHDLLPGRIAVMITPLPDRYSAASVPDEVNRLNEIRMAGEPEVRRGDNGDVDHAVLIADRAPYLDDAGVIEPAAYLPGELTRSLCAPWQYDFRDCGCFYWAASKPDVTSSADGSVREVNFLRRDRGAPPAPDRSSDLGGQRTALELTYGDLVRDWNVLPVVLDDREQPEPAAVGPGGAARPGARWSALRGSGGTMTPEQVADRLTELAGVEHALCVEYLYAHYSLNAPSVLPDSADELTRRAHAAGQEVFSVAVDEMRHLRWVNEALAMLGRRPVLARAEKIKRATEHTVTLERLTRDRLQWFVDVEAPSQNSGADPVDPDDPDSVDGMYVELHAAVVQHPELFPEADRLAHLIKLIIDEGGDHWLRFRAVQGHLEGLTEQQYLRPLATTAPDQQTLRLLDLSDRSYDVLLGVLRQSFERRDTAGGALMEQSRAAMRNMHELNHRLAARGVGPRFTLPAWLLPGSPTGDPQAADGRFVREAAAAAARARETIAALGDASLREMAIRHQRDTDALLAALARLDGGAPQRTPAPSGLPGGGG